MVDFQERDTRRGLGTPDEEEDDAADGEDAEAEEVGAEAEEGGTEAGEVGTEAEETDAGDPDDPVEAVAAAEEGSGSPDGAAGPGDDAGEVAGRSGDADQAAEGPEGGSGTQADSRDQEVAIDVIREALEERPDERDDVRVANGVGDGEPTDSSTEVTFEPTGAGTGDERDAEAAAASGVGEGDGAGEGHAADGSDEGHAGDRDDGNAGDRDGGRDHGGDEGHDHGGDEGHVPGDHDHHHHDVETLGVAVVTVSSSRTMDDDPSGDFAVSAMVDAGHDVVTRELIADDYDGVQHTVDTLVRRSDVDVVVTTGGTGVTPDDQTIEAVRPLFEKELPGFGELFRRLSVEDVGTRVVATRATAGVADGVPVFCLPGSTAAVELGVEEIITDVAPHLAGLAARGREQTHHDHEHGHPVE